MYKIYRVLHQSIFKMPILCKAARNFIFRAVGTSAAGTAFAAPVFLINDGRKFQYYGDSFRLRLMGPHVHPVTATQTNSLVISMSSATAEAMSLQGSEYTILYCGCVVPRLLYYYSYNVQYFLV